MTSDSEYDDIRPYCGNEIETARDRLCQSQEFLALFSILTKMDIDSIQNAL